MDVCYIQLSELKFKNSKFKELVQKYILTRRLQIVREQYMLSLSKEMKVLKIQCEEKKQEAMEKMVYIP